MSHPSVDLYEIGEESETVCCDSCKKQYTAFSLQDKQGYQCACFVQTDGIYGEYGSEEFDTMFLKWKSSEIPVDMAEGDVLCDLCVKELVENGVVESGNFDMDSWMERAGMTMI